MSPPNRAIFEKKKGLIGQLMYYNNPQFINIIATYPPAVCIFSFCFY